MAYPGLFCSLVAFWIYAHGLRGLDAGSAVNTMNLVPVFGVLVAVVILGKPVGFAQLLGGLVVMGGVTLGVSPSWGRTDAEVLGDVRSRADATDGLLVVGFTGVARTARTYEEYTKKMAASAPEDIEYLGVALYGDKNPSTSSPGASQVAPAEIASCTNRATGFGVATEHATPG